MNHVTFALAMLWAFLMGMQAMNFMWARRFRRHRRLELEIREAIRAEMLARVDALQERSETRYAELRHKLKIGARA